MKAVLPVTLEAHRFRARDAIAGDPALDFVNTVTGRDETPRDWIDSYCRLLEWAGFVQLLPERTLRALAKKARSEPSKARRALARAKALREALYCLLTRIIAGTAPPKQALEMLYAHWIDAVKAHSLRFRGGRVLAELRGDALDLDLVASIVAYQMVQRVLAEPVGRLRICRGPNCSWLFIDRSKAGRRCWCDMAVCGNSAKTRRFRMRSRQGRSQR
jgi:predicted RNA-binding Zn ribbon-like protein